MVWTLYTADHLSCGKTKVNLGHAMAKGGKPEEYQGKLHRMQCRHWGENMEIRT